MSTFLTFLKFLPEILSLVKYLSEQIQKGVSEEVLRATLKKFNAALDKAVKTKDTSDLEAIFRGKS